MVLSTSLYVLVWSSDVQTLFAGFTDNAIRVWRAEVNKATINLYIIGIIQAYRSVV
jgi:hypothetical protein